jgi:glycosyltransferase involved in cell wall biosynthesis
MKVSIITICRNEVKSIRKTLESILNQTYQDFEYIIVDGDSIDGTKEIIQQYIIDYAPKISHFVSEKDKGIYNAQNKGIRLSKGEYLIFINGGDSFYSNTVLAEIFEGKHRYNTDIIYGNLLIDRGAEGEELGYSPTKITLYHMLQGTLWHPVTLIKRELFYKCGFYDESLKIVGDYDFFLKAIFVQKATCMHLPITISRFNTEGIGSVPENSEIHQLERELCQKRYFDSYILEMASELKHVINLNDNQTKVSFGRYFNLIITKIKSLF